MIVVDASVLVTALVDDASDGDRARSRLAQEDGMAAPHLIDLEILSVLRRLGADGSVPDRRVSLAIQDLADLPLARFPHHQFSARVWELRHNLTPYDAAYVAIAETLDSTLLTADRHLANAPGIHCQIELLRP